MDKAERLFNMIYVSSTYRQRNRSGYRSKKSNTFCSLFAGLQQRRVRTLSNIYDGMFQLFSQRRCFSFLLETLFLYLKSLCWYVKNLNLWQHSDKPRHHLTKIGIDQSHFYGFYFLKLYRTDK